MANQSNRKLLLRKSGKAVLVGCLLQLASAIVWPQEATAFDFKSTCRYLPVLTSVGSAPLDHLTALVLPWTSPDRSREERLCAAMELGSIATQAAASYRAKDAESISRLALATLKELVPPNSTLRIAPLYVLAISQLNQGRVTQARATLREMEALEVNGPSGRGMRHSLAGAVLEAEFKPREANMEYEAALREFESGGEENRMRSAGVLASMAALYIRAGELDKARNALERTAAISSRYRQVYPMERLTLIYLQACLDARLRRWAASARGFEQALAFIHRELRSHPQLLAPVMQAQAELFEAEGRKKEAQAKIKAASELRKSSGEDYRVDVAELAALSRKGSR
jgi:tetratricopeptide (TPR) repeat protein